MDAARPLYIPVILGTVRRGRFSLPVARLMEAELSRRAGIETELVCPREKRCNLLARLPADAVVKVT